MSPLKTLCLSLLFLIACFIPLNAQTFGVSYGLNISKMVGVGENKGESAHDKLKLGLAAGITFDQAITKNLSFETAIAVSSKGIRRNFSGDIYSLNLLYAEMPLRLKAYIGYGSRSRLFISAGPYFALGFRAQSRRENDGDVIESKLKWSIKNENYGLNRLDYGAQIFLGKEFAYTILSIGYNRGFRNTYAEDEPGNGLNNSVFTISVGILFTEKLLDLIKKPDPENP